MVERVPDQLVRLDRDLVVIPTPGHTRGHQVLLYRDEVLFSGVDASGARAKPSFQVRS